MNRSRRVGQTKTTAVLVWVCLAASLSASPQVDGPRRIFTTGTPAELDLARSRGLDHLRPAARQRGIDPADLTVSSVHVDVLSMAHVRVQQSFRGIPVFGAEAIVHLTSTGEFFAETNDLVPNIQVTSPSPLLSSSDAMTRARRALQCSSCALVMPTDLWILRHDAVDHLVYRVQLRPMDANAPPSLPVVFVDARTGEGVWEFDALQTGASPRSVSRMSERP